MRSSYPQIVPLFDENPSYCGEAVDRVFSQMLPPSFFDGEGAADRFQAQLPILCWSPLKEAPFDLSFFLCCAFRPNAFRFFSEMVTRWIIPGRRLNALLQFALDFTMPDLGEEKYIAGEVRVRIESPSELEVLQRHLAHVENEIRLGVESYYQACRILEIKGLSADEKTALIQESIVRLIRHRPQDFDYDILTEMQHFLVICPECFKAERTYRHMSRIICVHYLFRRALKMSSESFPDRRYISVKLVRAVLDEIRPVLGVAVGVSFIRDNELFEARHVLSGIQSIIPEATEVEGAFFCNKGQADPICTLYLEIEREGGFSQEEIHRLKEELPAELKTRFEQRLNPIFMPQNEEMVMRNIVTLSNQLKYVRDLPQVMIEFNRQLEDHLEFLVILTRIAKPEIPSVREQIEGRLSILDFVFERTKIVGMVRKKYRKEATVMRVRLRKAQYLRKDHSVDLYKARMVIAEELERLIGAFRDYNGGTISKETELFEQLKESLGDQAADNAFLLENFFYSLSPPVMRSVLPAELMQKLFLMLIEEELAGEQPYAIRIQEDSNNLYAIVTSTDPHFHEALQLEGNLVTCFFPKTDCYSFGLICRSPSARDSLKIRLAFEELMSIKS